MSSSEDEALQLAAEAITQEALAQERAALVTLREAASLLNEPLGTVRGWVYRDRALPVEHVGKGRVRVRVSVLRQFYFGASSSTL